MSFNARIVKNKEEVMWHKITQWWQHVFHKTSQAHIALFIDCENISNISYVRMAFERLQDIGTIYIKQFYGRFGQYHRFLIPIIREYNAAMIDLQSEKEKNYADIRIVIDIMETLYQHKHITHIAIMSNDHDFTPLIPIIKKHHCHSIGLTTIKSPIFKNFETFIWLQECNSSHSNTQHDLDTQKLLYAIEHAKRHDGWANYQDIIKILRGFSSKKDWNHFCKEKVLGGDLLFAKTNFSGEFVALCIQKELSDEESKHILRTIIKNHNRKHSKILNNFVTLKRIRNELKALGYRDILTTEKIKSIAMEHPDEFLFEKSGNWIKIHS